MIESFVFLAIELRGESWLRADLAAITRELNRRFPMPAIVLFRHGRLVSLSVIDRRANLRDSTRDVIYNRITVVKDVRLNDPHRAHLEILAGLALKNLGGRNRPANFRELYDAWIAALSIQTLNKSFYAKLACWYFWAPQAYGFSEGASPGQGRLSLRRSDTPAHSFDLRLVHQGKKTDPGRAVRPRAPQDAAELRSRSER
ncbi:MAG: hypothetical protein M3Q32_13820 [Pseudomonadota bacterium]|nr:hypothetical protein [Pseudomonadota bacterium]